MSEETDRQMLLARGPWAPDAVRISWREDAYVPSPEETSEADRHLAALAARGSPSHDGLAARLVSFEATDASLALVLQPARWSLRLVEGNDSSISTLLVVRAADGRWLAGRRAAWVATWAGRWTLGAGGAVEVGENPVVTLTRELEEEWSATAERVSVEGLVQQAGNVLFVGQAWLAEGATVSPDNEHDAHAWWPPAVEDWPEEGDAPLRGLAHMLDRR